MSHLPVSPSSPFLSAHAEWVELLNKLPLLDPKIQETGRLLASTLQNGGKILTCGNGGSAADALHMSEELVGRYLRERPSLASICLNSDPTALTCIANDYGFDEIFARSLSSLGTAGDALVIFSTSGNSKNLLRALQQARSQKVLTVSLLGRDGGKALPLSDHAIIVPSNTTARIQEVHTMILHSWLEQIEQQLFPVA